MTRKQALQRAIEVLTEKGGETDAIGRLQEMLNELPIIHWTDASIRDRVEQFRLDHGRFPTASDFKKRGMPPNSVIAQHYGVSLQTWLSQNYPSDKPDRTKEKPTQTECFRQEYLRIHPKSSEDFNHRRSPGIRGWQTIAQYNQAKNWHELLNRLRLPIFPPTREKQQSMIHVNIISDFDPYVDSLDRILGIR